MTKDKTVLITGCSMGLGAATATYFANNGWNVVATMRSPDSNNTLEQRSNILVLKLDVQDKSTIKQSIEKAIDYFGKIDVVINNAGFGMNGIFESIPEERVIEQFDVNVFGAMNVTRAILPHFREKQNGLILNISSGVGVFGLPLGSLYTASKFALEGFTEAISYELASIGVVVKLIEPGAVAETGFPKRSAQEFGSYKAPVEYNRIIQSMGGVFQKFRTNADPDALSKVVQCIYLASTDNTNQLRYLVTEDIVPMVKLRRECSEEKFMTKMREIFNYELFR
ncbi:SDR family oxidoreductase [Rhizosphaericola mali]|uniref:SDR family oxidoreductase n=1 Tax=Rhizosphaericola mali TaxID=2545455 RepID=A0A5P2FYU5_9BACT|nr:SDR family oxidoreductase [Rhizosphaericola mali]QES88714.1 SDR family oxidoreductase [Rhizosphaericola mali]